MSREDDDNSDANEDNNDADENADDDEDKSKFYTNKQPELQRCEGKEAKGAKEVMNYKCLSKVTRRQGEW